MPVTLRRKAPASTHQSRLSEISPKIINENGASNECRGFQLPRPSQVLQIKNADRVHVLAGTGFLFRVRPAILDPIEGRVGGTEIFQNNLLDAFFFHIAFQGFQTLPPIRVAPSHIAVSPLHSTDEWV